MRIARIDRDDAGLLADEERFRGGGVHMQRVAEASEVGETELLSVWFPAGSRTKPHTHEVDQVLHVVEGKGIVATEDRRRIIRPGDIVVVPAGVWHWHGATPDTAMSHLSIKAPGATDWSAPDRDWESYMEGAE